MKKNSDKLKYLSLYNFKKYGSLMIILLGIFIFPKSALMAEINPAELIELTNSERIKNNLNALSINLILTEIAYNKANDIIKHQIFQHNFNNKKFSDWIKDSGYQYSIVGENLAIDFNSSSGVFKAWLGSDSHKKNILNKEFTEIGMAVLKEKFDNAETVLVVQIFGSPIGQKAPLVLGAEEKNIMQSEQAGKLNADQEIKYFNSLKINEDLYKKVSLNPAINEYHPNNNKFFLLNTFFIQHNNKLKILEKSLPVIFLIIISYFCFNFFGKKIEI